MNVNITCVIEIPLIKHRHCGWLDSAEFLLKFSETGQKLGLLFLCLLITCNVNCSDCSGLIGNS